AAAAYDTALARGAVGIAGPRTDEDASGKLVTATIAAYGDTEHTFVERTAYSGVFAPGFESRRLPPPPVGARVGLRGFDHVVATVDALRRRGLRFLDVPADYYDDVRRRLGDLDLPWEELQRLGVLVDRDEDGHLLQIFTENVGDRPTLFFEIIQRHGARGF